MISRHSRFTPADRGKKDVSTISVKRNYEPAICGHCGGEGACHCNKTGTVLVTAPKRACRHCEGVGCIYCGFTGGQSPGQIPLTDRTSSGGYPAHHCAPGQRISFDPSWNHTLLITLREVPVVLQGRSLTRSAGVAVRVMPADRAVSRKSVKIRACRPPASRLRKRSRRAWHTSARSFPVQM